MQPNPWKYVGLGRPEGEQRPWGAQPGRLKGPASAAPAAYSGNQPLLTLGRLGERYQLAVVESGCRADSVASSPFTCKLSDCSSGPQRPRLCLAGGA